MYVCMYIYIYIYTYTHMCIIHIYIYIYIYGTIGQARPGKIGRQTCRQACTPPTSSSG